MLQRITFLPPMVVGRLNVLLVPTLRKIRSDRPSTITESVVSADNSTRMLPVSAA